MGLCGETRAETRSLCSGRSCYYYISWKWLAVLSQEAPRTITNWNREDSFSMEKPDRAKSKFLLTISSFHHMKEKRAENNNNKSHHSRLIDLIFSFASAAPSMTRLRWMDYFVVFIWLLSVPRLRAVCRWDVQSTVELFWDIQIPPRSWMKSKTRKSKHNRVQSDDDNDDFGSSFDRLLSNSISFQRISVFENEIIKFSTPLFLAFTVRFELITFSTWSGRKDLVKQLNIIAPTRGWKTDIHFHSPIYFNELQSEIKIKYNDDDDRHTMNSLHANWQRSSVSSSYFRVSRLSPIAYPNELPNLPVNEPYHDAHQLFSRSSCRLITAASEFSPSCVCSVHS